MNKKAAIFKTAIRLFAAQGYEATTTLQIAREVGVTEPTVFYHFKNKTALFSTIIETASAIYMEQLNRLHPSGLTAFDAIEALIRMHFSIVRHEPECMRILIRTCPARFEDQENACIRSYRRSRTKLKRTVTEIIEKGMVQEEFRPVDVDATANMFIALLNGLVQRQIAEPDQLDGVEAATIEFCKMSLMNHHEKKEGRLKKSA